MRNQPTIFDPAIADSSRGATSLPIDAPSATDVTWITVSAAVSSAGIRFPATPSSTLEIRRPNRRNRYQPIAAITPAALRVTIGSHHGDGSASPSRNDPSALPHTRCSTEWTIQTSSSTAKPVAVPTQSVAKPRRASPQRPERRRGGRARASPVTSSR